MRVIERLLRGLVRLTRRGATVFLAGLVVGLVVNALSDPSVRSLSDIFRRLFDVGPRSIAWLNWLFVLGLVLLVLSPRLLNKLETRASNDVEVTSRLTGIRMPGLHNEAVVSVDGAATLQRCPNLHTGWHVDDDHIHFTHSDIEWVPPAKFAVEREAFRQELFLTDGKHDGHFVRIVNSPSAFTDAPTLVVRAESVRFSDLVFFRERMLDAADRAAYVNASVDSETISFPHGTSAQVVVVTKDGKVLMMQRSWKVRWLPGRWSCSLEETMTLDDVREGGNSSGALRALVVRAMREELGLSEGEHFGMNSVRLLSMFVESSERLLSVPFLFVVRVDVSESRFAELLTLALREDDEFRRWTFVTPTTLLAYLLHSDASKFHPTSRYRMLMYLLHEWGHQTLKKRLLENLTLPADDVVTAVGPPGSPRRT